MRLLLGGWQWPQPCKGATPWQFPCLLLVCGSSDTLLLVTTINCPHCALAISAQLRWTVVTSHQSDNCHVIITDHLVEIIKLSTDNRCQMIKRPQDVVKWRNEAVWRVWQQLPSQMSSASSASTLCHSSSMIRPWKILRIYMNQESHMKSILNMGWSKWKLESTMDNFRPTRLSMNIKYEKSFYI